MKTITPADHDCKCAKPVGPVDGQKSIKKRIMHFLFRWLAFFGIFAGTTVCPFCGQMGCPVGVGGAAAAGGFFALLSQNWRAAISTVKNIFKKTG
ncbi:MAG: hypothetical protein HF978_13545 [Desulfobacteraceae bacterium]|nr:hypothetical protein [Desulfobacteraceae bacterium]MBC2756567.1 hypothetical protein [Desulfobacteraceae bacterium]